MVWEGQGSARQMRVRPCLLTLFSREPRLTGGSVGALSVQMSQNGRSTSETNMAGITATTTDRGTILFNVVSDAGQQGQAELPIEMAEKLEAPIKEAVIGARMRRVEIALINMKQSGNRSAGVS